MTSSAGPPSDPPDRTPSLARGRAPGSPPEGASGPTPITPTLLAALPDKRLAQTIFDHIRDVVGEDYARLPAVLAALPAGFSLVYQLFALDSEIGSGGFNHYFYAGLDQYAPQHHEALRLIGAADHEQVLTAAHAQHTAEQGHAELQRLYAQGTPEAFAATYRLTALGQFDDAWYALEKQFDAHLAAFIRTHPELFVTSAS